MKVVNSYWEKTSDGRAFDAIELVIEVALNWHEQRRLLHHHDPAHETVRLPFSGMRTPTSDDISHLTLSYWTELEPDHLPMREEMNDLVSMSLDDLSALREMVTTPLQKICSKKNGARSGAAAAIELETAKAPNAAATDQFVARY